MTRKVMKFSLFCIFIVTTISVYVWFNLPDLERFPIHWNARGEVDGFGSRNDVGLLLLMFPITLVFAISLLHFMPKIEPLRQNIEDSSRAYDTVCMLTIGFLAFVGVVIALVFISPDRAKLIPKAIVIGSSLLFIGIGNVLGKVRQNFMFGIRTPWTLSSELSWERTHRLGARAFVIAGFLSISGATLLPASEAVAVFGTTVVAILLFLSIYSYRVWKADPNKRDSS